STGQTVRVPSSTSWILTEQLAYYRAIANEYEDHRIDVPGQDELLAAIDAFRPTGDVLEFACGSGTWTQFLVRSAKAVTALDAAPEMLARAKARDGVASVRFIEADLFSWRPDRGYDAVFFGFWLSHVPEEHFDSFWSLDGDVRLNSWRSRGSRRCSRLVASPRSSANRQTGGGRGDDDRHGSSPPPHRGDDAPRHLRVVQVRERVPRNGRVEESAQRLPAICDVENQEPLGWASRAHVRDVSLEDRDRVITIGEPAVEEAVPHESIDHLHPAS